LSTSRATSTEISVLSKPASAEGYRTDMVNACLLRKIQCPWRYVPALTKYSNWPVPKRQTAKSR
jgi:hypothetical protein